MPITPQDIQSKQFHVSFRGFDVDEVDKFLEKVSEEFLVLSLEHKQAFERIDTLEKELANYRNKEQAFQNAILSAQRISDEMQERSRRETEETLSNARRTADELTARSKAEAEATLLKATQEAATIKELTENKSRKMVQNLGAKMVTLTADVNRLITIKEGLVSDLRHLLEDYLNNLEEGLPAGLRGLQPLPAPEPALPPEEPEAAPVAPADSQDDEEGLFERIGLKEDLLEPAPLSEAGTQGTEVATEKAPGELAPADDSFSPQPDIAIASPEQGAAYNLEDPLDDLAPSISIRGSNDRKRR